VITSTPEGILLTVRVIPRAQRTACTGMNDDELVVRVHAPPVDGAANEALIAFFSSALGVRRRAIQIVSGHRGRRKRVAIAGVTADRIRALALQ
jgi:hypothetical protein